MLSPGDHGAALRPCLSHTALTSAPAQLLDNRNCQLTPHRSSPDQAGPLRGRGTSSQALPTQLDPAPISSFLWDPTVPCAQFIPHVCGCLFYTEVSPTRLQAACGSRTHLMYLLYLWPLTQCLALRGRNSGVPKSEIFCVGKERKGLPQGRYDRATALERRKGTSTLLCNFLLPLIGSWRMRMRVLI